MTGLSSALTSRDQGKVLTLDGNGLEWEQATHFNVGVYFCHSNCFHLKFIIFIAKIGDLLESFNFFNIF